MSNLSAPCRPTENQNASTIQVHPGIRSHSFQSMPPHMLPPPQAYHHYQQPPYMQQLSYHNPPMLSPMAMPSPIPYSMPPFPYTMPSLAPYGMPPSVQYPTSSIGPYAMPSLMSAPEAPLSVSDILHSRSQSANAVGSGSTQMQSRELKVSTSNSQGSIVVTRKEEQVLYENKEGKPDQAKDLSKDDSSRNILGSGSGDRRVSYAKHSAVDWSKK